MLKKTNTIIITLTSILLIFLFVNQTNSNSKKENQSICINSSSSKDTDSKTIELENRIQKIYKKVLKSTVSINNSSTGVLISDDGYILTASHVVTGSKLSRSVITLHDGTKYNAVHLGRDERGDYALLKIEKKGDWEYLELGDSASLEKDEACLMFGHPAGYQPDRPAVLRVGFYKGLKEGDDGCLQTTCIMMPGDSGGPLVDLDGKVIGVCSRIRPSIEMNFYPSVDKIKENWDKLINGEAFNLTKSKKKELSESKENKEVVSSSTTEKPFTLKGGKKYLINSIAKSVKKIHKSVVKIESTINDKKTETFGTIISSKGYIVAKASEVDINELTCELYNGTIIPAKIIGIDAANDLIVLQIAAKKIKAITLPKSIDTSVGKLVGTASFNEGVKYSGIIGAPARKIRPESPPQNFIGAYIYNTNEIYKVYKNSPAMVGGLKLNDIIIKFDSTRVKNSKEYFSLLRKVEKKQKVMITFLRDGKEKVTYVEIGYPPKRKSIEVSKRKSNFTQVFTHDMPIEVYETGTPVVDINGDVIGINIAKESRPCSFAIPIDIVLKAVQKITKDKVKLPIVYTRSETA